MSKIDSQRKELESSIPLAPSRSIVGGAFLVGGPCESRGIQEARSTRKAFAPFILFASSWFHSSTHTLLAVSDAQGKGQGHLWYDPHGSVLTTTLPVTLTEQLLSTQGLDSRLGLMYHGDGPYYDPAIAQALQPDPFGGVPQLPQTLNRYAAPPGASVVRQANPHLHPLLVTAGKGAAKTALTALTNPARGALIGLLMAPHPTGWVNLTIRGLRGSFPPSLANLALVETYEGVTLGEGVRCLFGCGDMGLRLRLFGSSVRDTIRRALGRQPVSETRAEWVFRPDADELVQVEVLAAEVETRAALSATSTFLLKHGVGLSWVVGLNFAVQYWFDQRNPYLTPQQRWSRGGVAAIGGGVLGYAFAAGATSVWRGPVGIAVGFTWGLIWFGVMQPMIFQGAPFAPSRRLAPLP